MFAVANGSQQGGFEGYGGYFSDTVRRLPVTL